MFLSEIEEILEATSMVEFQKCMVPLFRRIAHCINSSHFQVTFAPILILSSSVFVLTLCIFTI
jgi:hypothetical protein